MHVPRSGPAAAIEGLVEAVPALRPVWQEHLSYYEEPLPHVFFGDVTRHAVSLAQSRDDAALRRLATALEAFATSDDPDVENVVAVSFVEDLVLGDEIELAALESLKPSLGPAMSALVASFERHRDR